MAAWAEHQKSQLANPSQPDRARYLNEAVEHWEAIEDARRYVTNAIKTPEATAVMTPCAELSAQLGTYLRNLRDGSAETDGTTLTTIATGLRDAVRAVPDDPGH
jgi:hypothetical protein